MILATTDFESGLTRIAQDSNTIIDLTTYLTTDNEKRYIYDVMGKTLGDLFIADLVNGVPQTAKYLTIFNPFHFVEGDTTYSNIGLKEILKYFVYFEYTSSQTVINQSGGNQGILTEASTPEGLIKKGEIIYNRAVDNTTNLQCYLIDNSTDYPDFAGQMLDPISPI